MAPEPRDFLKGQFNLPETEEKILAFWKGKRIFEKSLAQTKRGKPFVFYEGPPYANGKPGIHHVLARVIKDVVLRYKTMRGYHVPRRAGWDTHGLPVEMAAEKALGFKTKREIEQFGVKRFNEEAKKQVWIYKEEWERLTERIGYWLDLKNAYVTYAPEYVETIWWTLAGIWRRKLLYKGRKVVQWCTRCGTALSSHELAQGYKEVTDRSAYVKFKLKKGQRIGNFAADDATYILSWTTTPWTLPGNVALAVGEDITYSFIRTAAPDRASYIVAKDLAGAVLKDCDFAVLGEIPGRRLVGLEYEPLFDIAAFRGSAAAYKVYPAGFVTTTDGTGIVHTAVMYGEDDYLLGKKEGLPEYHTVDEEGKFVEGIPGLEGDYVKAEGTEEKIFAALRRGGNLLRVEPYVHEYPHCWRCDTPVLYYARTSWFIKMSSLRKELLARNSTINWMPAHVKKGRFGEWLREAKDWNLSRERYWGVPLPVWECAACGHTEVADGIDGLSQLAGGARNRYWVMRHGEAESNTFNILDSGQQKFLRLTPRGERQVAASIRGLRRELGKRGERIDILIASDIARAKQTEAIGADALPGAERLLDKRLEEIRFGPALTGYGDEKYAAAFPTYESRFEKRPEGGESLRDVRTRLWGFLKDCEKKYRGKNILIVTHAYPAWMLFQAAEAWSERRAIREKEAHGRNFMDFAEIRPLTVKTAPRDDTGEVDLHRPFADAIEFPCPACAKKGAVSAMRRVPEVIDVWYDSGAMPLAQAHFPFEIRGAASRSRRPLAPEAHITYPADYIAEGMDQTRGWFYTMLAVATALGYEAPYRNVIAFGLVNDKFGRKMSKSKGNAIEPFAMIDKYGADALRWHFFTGTPFGEPKDFDEEDVAKAFRKMHLIAYHSFVFWKTYAAKKTARGGTGAGSGAAPKSANLLDKWILARLAGLVASVTAKLDRYEVREAALETESFADDLSRWYIRRSRRRLQRPERAEDYRAASATLGYALLSLAKLLAPFTPFFAEALYSALGGKKESVHLDAWPSAPHGGGAAAEKLVAAMRAVRELAAAGLAKRAEAGIKVRQPLASLAIGVRLPVALAAILADEVNVKKITTDPKLGSGVRLDTAISPELREEGMLRDAVRIVQELRQKARLAPKDRIALMVSAPAPLAEVFKKRESALRSEVGAKTVAYGRSEKFSAEEEVEIEGQPLWIALRKI